MPITNEAHALFREANTAFELGDLESAAEKYRRLLSEDEPVRGFATYNLNILHSLQKDSSGNISSTETEAIKIDNNKLKDAERTKTFLYRPSSPAMDDSEIETLRKLGAALLGPIIASYFKNLSSYLEKNKDVKRLHFLAREGFVLQHINSRLQKLNLIKTVDTTYLLCSRTLLFKLCLGSPELWDAVLDHHYTGSIRKLLSDRFHLANDEIKILCGAKGFHTDLDREDLVLPRDSEIVKDFFDTRKIELVSMIQPKTKAYLNYLNKIGFGKRPTEHVVDIGYAGTIQKILTSLTDKRTIGHYFITTTKAIDGPTSGFIGHLLSNQEFGLGVPILDRSLFIESMLTAPHGQVVDITETSGTTEFTFGKKTVAQIKYFKLFEIIEGATTYAIRALQNKTTMTPDELNSYYGKFVSTPYIFPQSARELFEIDDSISGLGTLNPIDFFKA